MIEMVGCLHRDQLSLVNALSCDLDLLKTVNQSHDFGTAIEKIILNQLRQKIFQCVTLHNAMEGVFRKVLPPSDIVIITFLTQWKQKSYINIRFHDY